MADYRDDSAGSYGTWSNPQDQSWLDWLKMKASDVQEGGHNAQSNILSALSPYGDEGWQVPPAVHEPINALARLFGTPSHPGTFTQGPDSPGNADDMRTLLFSMYGGNALNPGRLLEGAAAKAEMAPQRMYHGTSVADDFSTFRPSDSGSFGPGVYLSKDPAYGSSFAGADTGARVLPLDVTGPFASVDDYLTTLHANGRNPEAAQRALLDQGYTGVSGDIGGADFSNVTNVFKPGSVRSATTGETLFSDGLPSLWGNALAPSQEPRNALMDYAQNDQGSGDYLKKHMDQPYQPAPGEDFQYRQDPADVKRLQDWIGRHQRHDLPPKQAEELMKRDPEYQRLYRKLWTPSPYNPEPPLR